MKSLFTFVLFLSSAIPMSAQGIVMQQRCHAQACAFSSWNPNRSGDLLVAVIRPILKAPIACESSPQGCGTGVYLVTDLNGNHWQSAYSGTTSQLWYALDAKPATNLVGVVASVGYDGAGENSTGGDFSFDVIIAEYPPALGLDATALNEYYLGEGDDWPRCGAVKATTSKTLLIAWTNNRAVNNGLGPVTLTPDSTMFKVVTDDGYLALANGMVFAPGEYAFSGQYSGHVLWNAGLAAFRMK